MKKWIIALTVLAAAASQAALITNGGFSSTSTTTNDTNHLLFPEIDQGWDSKSAAQINGGVSAVFDTTGQSIQQVNSVTTETGTTLYLSFDWTPVAGAIGVQQNVSWQLVAWSGSGGETDTDRMFIFVNGSSDINADRAESPQSSTVWDLTTGVSTAARLTPAENIVAGVAGATTNFSTTIDLSGIGDISTFDYVGVKFFTTVDTADAGTEIAGSTLDNVHVGTSAIPEPATVGMLGLGALATMILRKLRG